MKSFPKKPSEYREQGYRFDKWAKCKGCGRKIAWVETPKGKYIPIDPINGDGEMLPHWSTCPNANDFRKK